MATMEDKLKAATAAAVSRATASRLSSSGSQRPAADGTQRCTPHMSLPCALMHYSGATHAGAAPKPGELDPLGVRLADLVTPGCTMALIMQFYGSLGEMFACCPALRDLQQLIVCVDDAARGGLEEELTALQQLGDRLPDDVRIFGPPVPRTCTGDGFKRFGTHHTKAMLLRFPSGLRFVCMTGCVALEDDNKCIEAVCWQDFPVAERRLDERPGCPFGTALCSFVEETLGGRLPPAEKAALLRWLASHDFRFARFALVPSVPGAHSGDDRHAYGHLALRRLLQQEQFPSTFRGGHVVCCSPSLNPVPPGFSAAMKASLTAGACTGGGTLDCADGDSWLRITWPSRDAIRNSDQGWLGGPLQTGSGSALACKGISRHLVRYEADAACSSQRAVSHVKMCARTDPDCKQLAWVLVGSHNYSRAAFGAPQKQDSQLHIKSYELSCLLLPRLECAYRRSPQFGFTCTPAPGAPPPAPDQGAFGATRVAFVPYAPGTAVRGRLVDLPGERVLVLPLPIPFSLNSEPYQEAGGADLPFCWGHDYGDLQDRLGRTFRQVLRSRMPGENIETRMLHQGMLLASGAATPAAKQRRLVGDDDDEEEGQLVTFYIPQDVLESQRRPRSSSKPSGSGSSKPSGSGGSAGWKGTPGVCCFLKLAQAAQAASAAALPHTPALQERRGLKRPPQAAGAADARQQQQQQEGPIDLTDS